jgi:hypothetical protein
MRPGVMSGSRYPRRALRLLADATEIPKPRLGAPLLKPGRGSVLHYQSSRRRLRRPATSDLDGPLPMVTPLLAELIVTGVWIVPNQGGRCRPASALQERKHLTGDEVPQIIDDAWDTVVWAWIASKHLK